MQHSPLAPRPTRSPALLTPATVQRGAHRVGIAVGGVCGVGYSAAVLLELARGWTPGGALGVLVAGLCVLAFLGPWALTRAVGWVVAGFLRDPD